jgi:putative phosphonate catabolism associated alcohol dehydrogenase
MNVDPYSRNTAPIPCSPSLEGDPASLLFSRAALFHKTGDEFDLTSFPLPTPGHGEVLVKVNCSTICGSDIHTWAGRRIEPTPCVLGHEIVGTIIAIGEAVPPDLRGDPLAIGDRVTWTLAASCGTCFFCHHDLPQKCTHLLKYGHTAVQPGRELLGGFADYCLLTAGTGIAKVPASLPDELAAPANCAVATVAACCRLAGPLDGAVVAVIGCGVLGLFACAMARTLGASEVIACDPTATRETIARGFGATQFVAPSDLADAARALSQGRGADVAIELSGSPAGVSAALDILRTGGTAIIAGTTIPCDSIVIDPNKLVRRMITIRGVHNYAPRDLVSALDFLETHSPSLPVKMLYGGRFPLADIDNAFAMAATMPGTRVAVVP